MTFLSNVGQKQYTLVIPHINLFWLLFWHVWKITPYINFLLHKCINYLLAYSLWDFLIIFINSSSTTSLFFIKTLLNITLSYCSIHYFYQIKLVFAQFQFFKEPKIYFHVTVFVYLIGSVSSEILFVVHYIKILKITRKWDEGWHFLNSCWQGIEVLESRFDRIIHHWLFWGRANATNRSTIVAGHSSWINTTVVNHIFCANCL